MKKNVFVPLLVVVLLTLFVTLGAFAKEKVILDMDLRLPPQDDSFASLLALNHPDIDVLGISLVFGNTYLSQEIADTLRWLEITGHQNVPVYAGFERPLMNHIVYEKITTPPEVYERPKMKYEGRYVSYPASEPIGGFAQIKLQEETAVDFIISTIMENPGEVTLIATGPLTNVAAAIRLQPKIVENVKQIVIMGGNIGSLPTPGYSSDAPYVAEFNFRMDAEAAKIVMTSGAPIVLSPLNASRKTGFTKEHYDEIVAMGGPVADIIEQRMGSRFYPSEDRPAWEGSLLMFDQLAVAYVIDPTLFTTKEMYVDVMTEKGPAYGYSFERTSPWPGGDDAKPVLVQYDLDWDRFIRLFIDTIKLSGE